MELQTKKQKILLPHQQRLLEITEILLNGICRLEAKERSQNQQIPLANNSLASVHSTSSNPNCKTNTL